MIAARGARRLATRCAACAAFVLAIGAHAQSSAGMTPSYQGLWWNSPPGSESGWGLNITHQGDILFVTWFTYDADGSGMWLVAPRAQLMASSPMNPYGGYGEGSGALQYSGLLYRTRGPAFDAASFDPAAVSATPVGSVLIAFTSPDAGTFTYTVDGMTQTKAIERQVFGTLPDCDFGDTPAAAPNFQGLWWRSPAGSESGWGVNVAHEGDTLFATWFTYDESGRGLWLVMSNGAKVAPDTYSGTLYRTRGPVFSAKPWDPAEVAVTAVGSATFAFSDADHGTFTATVDNVTQSKPITRQMFASPPSVCR